MVTPTSAGELSPGLLGAVQAADREIARQTALRARAVAEFAATRPASLDRAQGERGAMSAERWAARPEVLRPVSEWAAQELTVALSLSETAAEALLTRSLTLVHRLPATLAALEAGALHPGHLWPMLEKVAPIEDDTIRAEIENALLSWAEGRMTTPAQLGAKARREVLRRNARSAARRLADAVKRRGVHLRPEATDGMAAVTAVLTMPEAQALHRALGAYADELPDDGRTRGQKMADCLLDLVLRPGESAVPPVQVLLTVVASMGTLLGGDGAAEIDGHPVPAEMVRRLLQALAPAPTPPAPDGPARPAVSAAPWQRREQEELEQWWAELEARVLSEELGGPPLVADDAGLRGVGQDAGVLPDTPASDELAPASDEPAAPAAGRTGTTASSGWWAAADEAVERASGAVHEARQALGSARRLVRAAVRADVDDEAAWRASPAGRVTAADDALASLAAASDEARDHVAALLSATGGGLADRPRIALTDSLTGALLALTDLPGLRRSAACARPACSRNPLRCTHHLSDRQGLGPPGATDGYRPGAELDRWVRARDRRCRFPGCRRRVPRGGELDHDRPYPSGSTTAGNLVGYCTRHHRGKHQAPGWRHSLAFDGTLTVTTPTGLVAVTEPPPY